MIFFNKNNLDRLFEGILIYHWTSLLNSLIRWLNLLLSPSHRSLSSLSWCRIFHPSLSAPTARPLPLSLLPRELLSCHSLLSCRAAGLLLSLSCPWTSTWSLPGWMHQFLCPGWRWLRPESRTCFCLTNFWLDLGVVSVPLRRVTNVLTSSYLVSEEILW